MSVADDLGYLSDHTNLYLGYLSIFVSRLRRAGRISLSCARIQRAGVPLVNLTWCQAWHVDQLCSVPECSRVDLRARPGTMQTMGGDLGSERPRAPRSCA